jgi:hypothetical protein
LQTRLSPLSGLWFNNRAVAARYRRRDTFLRMTFRK